MPVRDVERRFDSIDISAPLRASSDGGPDDFAPSLIRTCVRTARSTSHATARSRVADRAERRDTILIGRAACIFGADGRAAAPGAAATRSTRTITTANGAGPPPTTAICSRSSASRASRPACPGSPSCVSARTSAAPSPNSTPRPCAAFGPTTSRGCSPTPASSAIAARSNRCSTTPAARSSCAPRPARSLPSSGGFAPARARPASLTGDPAHPGQDPGIHRAQQGAAPARLELRRPDDGLRFHAGDGIGGRPCRRLLGWPPTARRLRSGRELISKPRSQTGCAPRQFWPPLRAAGGVATATSADHRIKSLAISANATSSSSRWNSAAASPSVLPKTILSSPSVTTRIGPWSSLRQTVQPRSLE